MNYPSLTLTARRRASRWSWKPLGLILSAYLLGVGVACLPLPVALSLIVAATFFILIVIRPLIGLGLALLFGSFGALEDILIPGSLPASGQIVLIVSFMAWLAHGLPRRRIAIPRTFLNQPLMIFIGLAGISLLGARSLDYGLKELLKWLEIGFIMWIVVDLTTSPDFSLARGRFGIQKPASHRWLIGMVIFAGVSQAIIGIWQFAFWQDGPAHFLILDRFYRAFGTFMQPNPFGGFMGMAAGFAIGTASGMIMFMIPRVVARDWPPVGDWIWLLYLLFGAVVTSMALVMSWSRGAWLGFAAGLAVLVLFLPQRRRIGFLLLALAGFLFLLTFQLELLPASISGRLISFGQDFRVQDVRGQYITTDNYAVVERLAHWQAGAEMARDNFWSGVGFGNYEPAYPDYGLLNWPFPLGHAHNYYLNILAEVGFFGAVAYLFFWLFVFIQVFRLLKKLDWPKRGVALGLLATWTALTVHHVVDKLYVNNLYIMIGILLGIQQLLATGDD